MILFKVWSQALQIQALDRRYQNAMTIHETRCGHAANVRFGDTKHTLRTSVTQDNTTQMWKKLQNVNNLKERCHFRLKYFQNQLTCIICRANKDKSQNHYFITNTI